MLAGLAGIIARFLLFRMTITWPKSITCWRDYNARTLLADGIAGVTVGLVALPLAMAFAISSGLSPAGRSVLRRRHRLSDLGAGRLANSDRRADRGVRRRRLRHRRQARRRSACTSAR